MKIVYCDGIFDLFHVGHVRHFKKIISHAQKETLDDIYLIVGIINDNDATGYKRKPVYDQNERYEIISSIKYVNRAISNAPLIINQQFIEQYQIDLVYHAFMNNDDNAKQTVFFEVPVTLGIFRTIAYDESRSTTQTIEKIKSIV